MSFIQIKNLTHTYDLKGRSIAAIKNIDLKIDRGEYIAIIGANGSGKTTLAKHLNAILVPTEGSVRIDGLDTKNSSHTISIRSQIGMIFQNPSDQIVATIVEEDVAFGPENLGLPEDELPLLVEESLKQVKMWEQRDRAPHTLSPGQQQRIAIAGALAMRPQCLVLDEATSMLDPGGAKDLLDLLDQLHESGLTIISVTHKMEEAARAGRVIILQDGQIVRDGLSREIFSAGDLKDFGLTWPVAADLTRRLIRHLPQLDRGSLSLTIAELSSALGGLACRK